MNFDVSPNARATIYVFSTFQHKEMSLYLFVHMSLEKHFYFLI